MGSMNAFKVHRVDGACLTEKQMRAAGLILNFRHGWVRGGAIDATGRVRGPTQRQASKTASSSAE